MLPLTGPIVRSRLEPDFYKFTMGQLIWRKYRDVPVTFALKNRTPQAALGRVLDAGELREQLDHARQLTFTSGEIEYLRSIDQYGARLFDDGYLAYLASLRMPACTVDCRGDDLVLECEGAWAGVTYWETVALSIVNETYYRTLLRDLAETERQAILDEGERRLGEKIEVLRRRPDVAFSDFGTRRRFSAEWQYHVDRTLNAALNQGAAHGPFLGTSNTHAASTIGLTPMGTSAHELPMVLAGLLDRGDDDPAWLRQAQRQVIDDWWEQYGWGLSIFLPDTFGTDVSMSVIAADDLRRWKGFRWDSGDVFAFADRIVAAYERHGIDPREKMLVLSDALDLPTILDAQDRLAGRIRTSYGWGTGLTNDLLDGTLRGGRWFGPMSLVIKPIRAGGRGLVKLSDNPAKAIGAPDDVERYKRAAGYGAHTWVAPKY